MSVVALSLHCDPARSRGSWQCGLTEWGVGSLTLMTEGLPWLSHVPTV